MRLKSLTRLLLAASVGLVGCRGLGLPSANGAVGTEGTWGMSLGGVINGRAQVIQLLPGSAVAIAGEYRGKASRLKTTDALQHQLGEAQGGLFLTRLDAQRRFEWMRTVSGESVSIHGLATSGNHLWLVGMSLDEARFSAPGKPSPIVVGPALFVACYGTDGTLRRVDRIQHKPSGSAFSASARSEAATADGGLVVAGTVSGELAFTVGSSSVSVKTGAIALDDESHGFLARYRGDGSLAWVRPVNVDGSVRGLVIAEWPDGDLFVAGYARGTLHLQGVRDLPLTEGQFFLARLEPTGLARWAKVVAETKYGLPLSIQSFHDDLLMSFRWQAHARMGSANGARLSFDGQRMNSIIALLDNSARLRWATNIPAAVKAPIVLGERIVVPFELGNGTENSKAIELRLDHGKTAKRMESAGQSDIGLVQIEANGVLSDAVRLGGAGEEHIYGVAAGIGGMYAVGQFSQELLLAERPHDVVLQSTRGLESWVAFFAGDAIPASPSGQISRRTRAAGLARRAQLALRNHAFSPASYLLRQAMGLDPYEVRYPLMLAHCLERQGEKQSAIAAYVRAIRLSSIQAGGGDEQRVLRQRAYRGLLRLGYIQEVRLTPGECTELVPPIGCARPAAACAWQVADDANAANAAWFVRLGATASAASPPSDEDLSTSMPEIWDTPQVPFLDWSENTQGVAEFIDMRFEDRHRRQGGCHAETQNPGDAEACAEPGADANSGCRLLLTDACAGLAVAHCTGDAERPFREAHFAAADP